MILTVTLNPSVDHALAVEKLKLHDTNRVIRTARDAGGKGVNLSRVVAELDGKTLATGFLGGGPGAYIRKVLEAQGVGHDFIEVAGDTRVNFSVEDESDEPPTTFNEKGPEIRAQDLESLIGTVDRLITSAKWVALGGSLPPGVPTSIYRELGDLAKRHGVSFALDADGDSLKLGLENKPNLIKPNQAEAGRLLGRDLVSDEDVFAAVKELRDRADIVIISRGEDGAVMSAGGEVFLGISPKVDAKSSIGSGDSMVAGVLFGLTSGQSPEDAFRLGIACGAATATTDGSEIARRPVIDELLQLVKVTRMG